MVGFGLVKDYLSFIGKYCHSVLIFSQWPLKFNCAVFITPKRYSFNCKTTDKQSLVFFTKRWSIFCSKGYVRANIKHFLVFFHFRSDFCECIESPFRSGSYTSRVGWSYPAIPHLSIVSCRMAGRIQSDLRITHSGNARTSGRCGVEKWWLSTQLNLLLTFLTLAF